MFLTLLFYPNHNMSWQLYVFMAKISIYLQLLPVVSSISSLFFHCKSKHKILGLLVFGVTCRLQVGDRTDLSEIVPCVRSL